MDENDNDYILTVTARARSLGELLIVLGDVEHLIQQDYPEGSNDTSSSRFQYNIKRANEA